MDYKIDVKAIEEDGKFVGIKIFAGDQSQEAGIFCFTLFTTAAFENKSPIFLEGVNLRIQHYGIKNEFHAKSFEFNLLEKGFSEEDIRLFKNLLELKTYYLQGSFEGEISLIKSYGRNLCHN